jgi:hypothetical protein
MERSSRAMGPVPRYPVLASLFMSTDDKRPLGRILLQRKLVPRELEEAREPKGTAVPAPVAPVASMATLPEILEGSDAETDTLLALSERTGAPALDLRQVNITLDHLDFVPREVAEALRILPVTLRDDRIYLAMANPQDKRAVDELEFVTGKSVQPFIAVHTTLLRTITAAYEAKARGEREYRGSRAPADPSD